MIVALCVVGWVACGCLAIFLRASMGGRPERYVEVYSSSFLCGPLSLVIMAFCALVAWVIVAGEKRAAYVTEGEA